MKAKSIIDEINEAYSLFDEELSRRIFEDRICIKSCYGDLINDGLLELRHDFLFRIYKTSKLPEVEREFGKHRIYAIIGAGKKGEWTLRAFRHAGYNVEFFVDSDESKRGKEIQGVKVISFDDFVLNDRNIVAVIANKGYAFEFLDILRKLRYPSKNIYFHKGDVVINVFGKEYFDFWEHEKGVEEVFLDVGSYDGMTSKQFMEWCDDEYEKIYAIEGNANMCKIMSKNFEMDSRVEIVNKLIGEKVGSAFFENNLLDPEGSKIVESGSEKVRWIEMTTIDELLKGKKCTFIKLDIEGAEEMALVGAANTIKKYKPKLAISAYHLDSDLFRLPKLIKELNGEYKLYLRHYTNTIYDVVLYAI